jgi:hypothetical protein
MLAGKVRKYTAAKRSESGTDMEVTDSELFFKAALVIEQAAQDLVTSRGRKDWMTLLQALAQLSAAQAQHGDPAPLFAPEPLRAKCADFDPREKGYWLTEEDSGRKKFGKAWDALIEVAPRLEANFLQRSQKAGIAARLELFDTQKDLDKRAKLYGFRVVPIELPEGMESLQREVAIAEERQNLSSADIEYLEEMEVYPIPGVRRPLRINVQGWRSLFMTLPLIVVVIAVVFGGWLLLQFWVSQQPVRVIFQWTVLICFFGGMITWLVWPLYRLIDQKIVMAPAILQMTSRFYHVLVIRREGERKVIRMLRFTATCPLCGGEVEVQEGRRALRGRYVGECGRNPIEHVFTFDHVLKSGRRISM